MGSSARASARSRSAAGKGGCASSRLRFPTPPRSGEAGRPSCGWRWQSQPAPPAAGSDGAGRSQHPAGAAGAWQQWTGATPAARGAATAGASSRQQPAQASRAPGDRRRAAVSAAARAARPGAAAMRKVDPRPWAAAALTQRRLRPGVRPCPFIAASAPCRNPSPAAPGRGAVSTPRRLAAATSPVSGGRRDDRGGGRATSGGTIRGGCEDGSRPVRFSAGFAVGGASDTLRGRRRARDDRRSDRSDRGHLSPAPVTCEVPRVSEPPGPPPAPAPGRWRSRGNSTRSKRP